MKRAINWLLLNGGIMAIAITGYVYQVDGALNLTVALVVINFLASFAMLAKEIQEHMAERGRSVPAWIDGWFDVVMLAIFAWFGSFILFTLYLLSTIFKIYGWDKASKIALDKSNPDPESV